MSYDKVSGWSTGKLKASYTSSKLGAVCLTGAVTPSGRVGLTNLHPAESVPVKGTGFYFRGQPSAQNKDDQVTNWGGMIRCRRDICRYKTSVAS